MIEPFVVNPKKLVYPPTGEGPPQLPGVFPVDFILESILKSGLEWFRTDPKAPGAVFGQLLAEWLQPTYGQDKIDEITDYIKKFEIRFVQHFSLIAQNLPCISVQLLEGNEEEARAGLEDHLKMVDVTNDMEANTVVGREQYGYLPIIDNLHIGIHASETPDLVKYLYYLFIFILSAFKADLQDRGLNLTTFRATDLSRLNEYLPDNVYSRFINFTTFTIAPFKKSDLPIIDTILGLNVGDTTAEISDEESVEIKIEDGITLSDTQDSGE